MIYWKDVILVDLIILQKLERGLGLPGEAGSFRYEAPARGCPSQCLDIVFQNLLALGHVFQEASEVSQFKMGSLSEGNMTMFNKRRGPMDPAISCESSAVMSPGLDALTRKNLQKHHPGRHAVQIYRGG
jgi:hypothetical protein